MAWCGYKRSDGLGKFTGDRIDEERAFAGEAEVRVGEIEEALLSQLGDGGLIFFGEEFAGKALNRSEHEGEAFETPGIVVEGFGGVLGVAEGVDSLEIGRGVADVLVAFAIEGGDGRGAESEVVVARPVALIVAGAVAGESVVGRFVVFESGADEHFVGERKHLGVEFGVVDEVALFKLLEEGGVFFVGEIVGGDVVGLKGESLGEGVLPIDEGLSGNGEDKVDVDFE